MPLERSVSSIPFFMLLCLGAEVTQRLGAEHKSGLRPRPWPVQAIERHQKHNCAGGSGNLEAETKDRPSGSLLAAETVPGDVKIDGQNPDREEGQSGQQD